MKVGSNISRQPTSGFTLVELLVVIAIFGVLASLLLTALASAKERARTATCINNQRQLYLGWSMYTHDGSGVLPGNASEAIPERAGWVAGFMGYETDPWFATFGRDSTNKLLLNPGKFGSIGPFVGSADVYKCPSDKSWLIISGARHARVRSFTMNNFIGHDQSDVYPVLQWFYTESDLANAGPDRIYLFMDEHEDTIDGDFFDFIPGGTKFFSVPASRHGGGGVVSYASGSVSLKKWKDPRTRIPFKRKRVAVTQSPNNVDIDWLTWHSTLPK